MGVKGLTTYIYSKRDVYFDEIKLHDCSLIIDGNSLASVLFSERVRETAYGGDYDVYANELEKFIDRLRACRVTPVVVFDGGVERRKLRTAKYRNTQKMLTLARIHPGNDSGTCYPLMLRRVSKDKLRDMGVAVLQSDFEADYDIAVLARLLKSPVLSNDSDFFIFDVLYIPLSMLDHSVVRTKNTRGHRTNYLCCSVFRAEKFLQSLGGLDRSKLPLVAVLLGNDYVSPGFFNIFFNQIKKPQSKRLGFNQRKIRGLLQWLKHESVASAVDKVSSYLRPSRGNETRRLIKRIMDGYDLDRSILTQYLPENVQQSNIPLSEISLVKVEQLPDLDFPDIDGPEDETNDNEDSSESDDDFLDAEDFKDPSYQIAPSWFLHLSRQALVCPSCLTLLTLRTYFCLPQPEYYAQDHSGIVGVPLIKVIAGLLNGRCRVRYWHRDKGPRYMYDYLESITSLPNFGELPKLEDLGALPAPQKKLLLLETLNFRGNPYEDFPADWQLFMLAIHYWIDTVNSNNLGFIAPYMLHAILIMALVVNVITSKIGFHRKPKKFLATFGDKLARLKKAKPIKPATVLTLTESFKAVTYDDCLKAHDILIANFKGTDKYIRTQNYSQALIHPFAQFQICLDLAINLSLLLGAPLETPLVYKFFNGTFLYNIAANLKKRSSPRDYLTSVLSRSLSLMNLYVRICQKLETAMPEFLSEVKKQPRKKRTARKDPFEDACSELSDREASPDRDDYLDPNNPFALLGKT